MGNYVSCLSSNVPSNVVKVIALNGNVQEFQRAVKAAELMLDNPHHFVCHSNSLLTGRRILAISADDELELGHLYFLLPMNKLHSSISPSEMASLAFKADSALQKSTSNSRSLTRILPVLGDLCQFHGDRRSAAMSGGDELKEKIVGAKEKAEPKRILMPKLQVGDADADADAAGEVRESSMRIPRFPRGKRWKPVLETISESPRTVKRKSNVF